MCYLMGNNGQFRGSIAYVGGHVNYFWNDCSVPVRKTDSDETHIKECVLIMVSRKCHGAMAVPQCL